MSERCHPLDETRFDVSDRVSIVLVVDARHLLIATGDDPHFLDCWTRPVLDEPVAGDACG